MIKLYELKIRDEYKDLYYPLHYLNGVGWIEGEDRNSIRFKFLVTNPMGVIKVSPVHCYPKNHIDYSLVWAERKYKKENYNI